MQQKQPPKRKVLSRILYNAVIIIATLLLGWVFCLYLSDGLDIKPIFLLIPFYLLLVIIVILIYDHNYLKIYQAIHKKFPQLTKQKTIKIIFFVALGIGIIARLSFLIIAERYQPVARLGDTGVHWYYSQELIKGEAISPYEGIYEGFYPHLLTYSALLAFFMGLLGNGVLAICLSNLLFDILAVLLLYSLLRLWKNRTAGYLGAIIWLLNPLEILYCGIGMSIVVTNTFLTLSLFLTYLLVQSIQQRSWLKIWLYALALGVAIGVGNALRPFFIVFIIAFVIFSIYQVLSFGKKYVLPYLMSAVILIVMLATCGMGIDLMHQSLNPYHVPGGVGVGWNFFVGSNYDSLGRWNSEDYEYWKSLAYGEDFRMEGGLEWDENVISEIDTENIEIDQIQEQLFNQGIERYKSMNLYQILTLLVGKSQILFSDNSGTITWPFYEAYRMDENNPLYLAIHSVGVLLQVVCICFALLYFLHKILSKKANQKEDKYLFFLALSFCGIVAISLLSEAMRRYCMPISIFFIIFATCELRNLKIKKFKPRSKVSHS